LVPVPPFSYAVSLLAAAITSSMRNNMAARSETAKEKGGTGTKEKEEEEKD
jgi:hypothetical protein